MSKRSSSQPNKVWKFIHREDEFLRTTIIGEQYESENGLLKINPNGEIQINATCLDGYAWDGCTPKWELLDFTIGTPDGRLDYITEKPITYFASMVHDILYQFKSEIPISRLVADKLFYKILKEAGFIWAGLYYYVVRIAGSFFGKWKVKTKVKDLKIVETSWINKAYNKALELKIDKMDEYDIVKTAKKYMSQKRNEL